MPNRAAAQAIWSFTEHEHRALARGLNHLHDVACGIGAWAGPDLSSRLLNVVEWLETELEPHVAWEESWLYPAIDTRTGTVWATRASRFDHAQIRALGARVRNDQHRLHEPVTADLLADIRCHLFGLEALLRAHLEREERFLMPLLADDTAATEVEPWSPARASG